MSLDYNALSPPANTLEKIFATWLHEHAGILTRVARSFASDPVAQGELVQDMMLALWRSVSHFRGDAKASTWIYRVCLNTAVTWQRGDILQRRRMAPLDKIAELPASTPRPAEAHERAETLARLTAAVRALPPPERSLVLLMLDGLSYREISAITGLTENHVGVALARARKKLVQTMKESPDVH